MHLIPGIVASSFTAAAVPANFKTLAYTGNAASHTITGAGFQPDAIVDFSASSATPQWPVGDIGQTVGNYVDYTGSAVGVVDAQSFKAFNADGFVVGTSSAVNANAVVYQAQCWKKGNNIFDLQTFTGNITNRTISHSLGITPSMIWVNLPSAGRGMIIYHSSMGPSSPETWYDQTQNATIVSDNTIPVWNNTAPTSSVFSLGTNVRVNANGVAGIAYLFGQVAGLSSFGSYTGNGSASGPSVSCGFQPSFVMIMQAQMNNNNIWGVYGSTSSGKMNIAASAKDTTNYINLTATGFDVKTTNADFNTNTTKYIYAAWQ